jgi:clan AA aspartic protease
MAWRPRAALDEPDDVTGRPGVGGSAMAGPVRVKTRLTNAVDEALARRGMLALGQVRWCEADALVDTGAVRTVVPGPIAAQLGLGIRGQRAVEYADGRTELVSVTEPLVIEIEGRDTLEEALVLGTEVLIGQTVLEKLDLSWTVTAGGSSRIPFIPTSRSRRSSPDSRGETWRGRPDMTSSDRRPSSRRVALTLDPDVAAMLRQARARRREPLRKIVNEALREGLTRPGASRRSRLYRTPPVSLGRCLIGSLDDVAEALAVAEGEDFRCVADRRRG